MGAPAGGPMAAGGGAPPLGGGPPSGGGMGGNPLGGGMAGPMGGMSPPAPTEPPVIPRHADVWDVLDHILNHKPLNHDEKQQKQNVGTGNPPNSGLLGSMGGPQGMGAPQYPSGSSSPSGAGPLMQ